jgi:hypothetical protein
MGIGVLWLVLHSADYLLTVAAARLKTQGNLAERVRSGGSMELNPVFQRAVDQGQWLSRRFVLTLVLGAVLLPAAVAYFDWTAEAVGLPAIGAASELLAGALVVTRFAVISVHLQNIALFRRMLRVPEAAVVHMHYDRGTVMAVTRARKLEVASFSTLAALVSGRPFFVGGTVATLGLVLALVLWERRQGASASASKPSG